MKKLKTEKKKLKSKQDTPLILLHNATHMQGRIVSVILKKSQAGPRLFTVLSMH